MNAELFGSLESQLRQEKAAIRKESNDLYNRLHSIHADALFVREVRAFYPKIPLLPNLRCGAWYSDPQISLDVPVYFKSTDGHHGNWSFNLRRPNVHLLRTLAQHQGVLLVDSTRAGKRIPDALSKTIPIWCAVVNRAMMIRFPDACHPEIWDAMLYTASGAVSPQEHHQIEGLLDDWAVALAGSTYDMPKLAFPLRPIWVTPSTSQFPALTAGEDGGYTLGDSKRRLIPLVCISASRQVHEGIERRVGGFAYIQGSGDDHELWGMGLTPEIFWRNEERLLSTSRAELPMLVSSLVNSAPAVSKASTIQWKMLPTPVLRLDGRMMICPIADLPFTPLSTSPSVPGSLSYLIIGQGEEDDGKEEENTLLDVAKSSVLRMQLCAGKRGQARLLQSILPRSMEFMQSRLTLGDNVCVACDTGNDISVGVALAALVQFFDSAGSFVGKVFRGGGKEVARTRLQWIISSRPSANPSRTTLKRVNEYLMSPPRSM